MSIRYKLKRPIGSTHSTDLDDVWVVKKSLSETGDYQSPEYGMTPYPDDGLFEAIKRFQSRHGLQVDGVMEPEGETEDKMRELLEAAAMYRCVHCGAWHGGVYSPRVCADCWGKGLR